MCRPDVPYGCRVTDPGRRAFLAVMAGGVLAGLAACSDVPPSAAPPATTAAPQSAPPAVVSLDGSPLALVDLITGFYRGEDTGLTAAIAAAVNGRRPATGQLHGEAITGRWRNESYALVLLGDDVTFAVRGTDQWQVVGGWWPALGVKAGTFGPAPRTVLEVGSGAHFGEDVRHGSANRIAIVGADGQGAAGSLDLATTATVRLPSGAIAPISAATLADGPDDLLAIVRTTTAVPVEGYLMVGADGLDAILGGLENVTVPIYNDKGATLTTMNGKQAVELSRKRFGLPTGPANRTISAGTMLLSIGGVMAVGGIRSLPAILNVVDPFSVSDRDAAAMLTLLGLAARCDPGKVVAAEAEAAPPSASHEPTGWNAAAAVLFKDITAGSLP